MDNTTMVDNTLFAQKVFISVMNALSHPLQAHSLSVSGQNPLTKGVNQALLDLCFTFLDNTVGYYVYGDNKLSEDIQELTYAQPASLENADFVIIKDSKSFDMWDKVNQGTLLDPHKGAIVIVELDSFYGDSKLTAQGPGINGIINCSVNSLVWKHLNDVSNLNIEYPKGFEIIFVTHAGEIYAVPRRIKITEGGSI